MRRICTIAGATYREAARSRLFLALLGFSLLCLFAVTPYAHATIGEPLVVIKSVGIAGASLGSVLTVIIAGASFLEKDLRRKTIVLLLARPLRRWELLVGRWCGLTLVGTLIQTVIIGTTIVYCSLFEGGAFDWRLAWSIPGGVGEVAISAGLTMFFSSIVATPVLNGMAALCLFIAGRSYHSIEVSLQNLNLPIISSLSLLIPDLEHLYAGNGIIFGELPDTFQLIVCITYAIMFAGAVVGAGAGIFERRDVL